MNLYLSLITILCASLLIGCHNISAPTYNQEYKDSYIEYTYNAQGNDFSMPCGAIKNIYDKTLRIKALSNDGISNPLWILDIAPNQSIEIFNHQISYVVMLNNTQVSQMPNYIMHEQGGN